MGNVTPLAGDEATKRQHELVSAIAKTGKFGTPQPQETSDGQEFMFHCPICTEEGKGEGHRAHLRVARAKEAGRVKPFVGCRVHDTPDDWKQIKSSLLASGIPAELLEGKGLAGTGRQRTGAMAAAGRSLDKARFAEYKPRGDGIGESDPIPEAAVRRWQKALWQEETGAALAYLQSRGLLPETIEAAEIGLYKSRIIVPIRGVDGSIVAARWRAYRKAGAGFRPLPHPKRKHPDTGKPLTYGVPTRFYGIREVAAEKGIPVWIVGGEFDKLRMTQEGFLAITSTSGEGAMPRYEDAELLSGRDVFVCLDCDKAGRLGARKHGYALHKIGASSIRIVDLNPSRDDGFDVSDYFDEYDSPDYDAAQALADKASLAAEFEPVDAGEVFDLTELSDRRFAEIVAAEHADSLKFVVPSQVWIEWNGQRWVPAPFHDNSPATNRIVQTAREYKAQIGAIAGDNDEYAEALSRYFSGYLNRSHSSVREHLSGLAAMRVPLEVLDAAPVLNTPAGTLDLISGDVTPHDPGLYLRWITNGSYVRDRATLSAADRERFARWQAFVKRVLPSQELRRYVQKLLGYSLLDGNPRRLLVFMRGGTSTGKSVFAETIMRALGSYAGPFNMSLLRDNQDERPRADIVEALTQKVIFASETSAAWHLHADAIKRMTGGDTIKARLPHRAEYVERIPAFTPWVRTNEVPQVNGADKALERRLVVVPFNVFIAPEEEDVIAMERLRNESGDAVITWAVAGLRRYLSEQRRGIDPFWSALPVAMADEKMEFMSQLSQLHVFLDSVCEFGPAEEGYETPTAELYSAYEMWAVTNGIKSGDMANNISFGKQLTGLGIGTRISNSVRYRTGVRLRSESRTDQR